MTFVARLSQKFGQSLLGSLEKRFIAWAAPRVPQSIRSHHLTLATIPISIGVVACGYLAAADERWLWGSSVLIIAQWLTDSLDGAVGRLRKEGLVSWGYYMDHFLDYVFLVAVLTSYMLLLPEQYVALQFLVLAIFAAYMVHSFLAFGATNEFRIVHMGVGPTEVRLVFVLVNTLLAIFGKTHLSWSLPFVLGFSIFGLLVVVYRTQRAIWQLDMERVQREKEHRL